MCFVFKGGANVLHSGSKLVAFITVGGFERDGRAWAPRCVAAQSETGGWGWRGRLLHGTPTSLPAASEPESPDLPGCNSS